MRCITWLAAAVAAAASVASSASASATDLPFDILFDNIASSGTGSEISIDPFAADYRARFQPIDHGAFLLLVSTSVDAGLAGDPYVGAIYVETGGLFTLGGEDDLNLGTVGEVEYGIGSGLTLPQGGNLTPPFDADFSLDRRTGRGNAYALQSGETFGMRLTYADDVTFGALRSAALSGLVRIGMHVRSIDTAACRDCSDAIVTGGFLPLPLSLPPITEEPPTVPVPAALPLAATGIAALGLYARRRRAAR